MVVVGVDQNVDPVGEGLLISPCELTCDAVGLRVECPEGDEERLRPVEDSDLRRLRRGVTLARLELNEVGRDRGALPGRLVDATIDLGLRADQ